MKELQTSDFHDGVRRMMRISDLPLNSEGVWCEVLTRPPGNRPALFLDRDGTVIEDTEYLCRQEDIANSGMLLQAARDLALDLKSSWLVGDKASDVEVARRAGIAGALQVA